MIKKKKKYYIIEMRYKPNDFLLDEVEYFRSEKKAQRKCDRLNDEVKKYTEVLMMNKPFVGKGCISFAAQDIYYTVSDLRELIISEWRRDKGNVRDLYEQLVSFLSDYKYDLI